MVRKIYILRKLGSIFFLYFEKREISIVSMKIHIIHKFTFPWQKTTNI